MDIVIPLRRAIINEPLRYTVRSIEKNMPGHKIWFSGYAPKFFSGNLNVVENTTFGDNKYWRSHHNQLAAVKHSGVSDPFLLFNDDFFVMKPVGEFEDRHRGPLTDSIARLEAKVGASGYLGGMKLTLQVLKELGVEDPVDYGLHIPLTIHKDKWLEAWKIRLQYKDRKYPIHMRTLYGNLAQVATKQMDDVKISEEDVAPTGDETFLSSMSDSFTNGLVGEYVKSKFPEPSEYEGGPNVFVLK